MPIDPQDHDEERLLRIEQMIATLRNQTAELHRLTAQALRHATELGEEVSAKLAARQSKRAPNQ
jgi:hypothetical protein